MKNEEGSLISITPAAPGETLVRDLVWNWLVADGRTLVHFSDVAKGLCGPNRRLSRMADDPRASVRAALVQLEAEGRLSLSPTTFPGRGGKPGLQIEVVNREEGPA